MAVTCSDYIIVYNATVTGGPCSKCEAQGVVDEDVVKEHFIFEDAAVMPLANSRRLLPLVVKMLQAFQ